MTRVSPQVLVQLARRTVERELKCTRTELHAPPIPEGAVTDDPLAELSPLDVRRRATSPRAVWVGSFARRPASRVVRSAPPRVVAPWRRTDLGPLRAPNGPASEPGRGRRRSGSEVGRGARGRSSPRATSACRDGRRRAPLPRPIP
jgi:hypothetical protein